MVIVLAHHIMGVSQCIELTMFLIANALILIAALAPMIVYRRADAAVPLVILAILNFVQIIFYKSHFIPLFQRGMFRYHLVYGYSRKSAIISA